MTESRWKKGRSSGRSNVSATAHGSLTPLASMIRYSGGSSRSSRSSAVLSRSPRIEQQMHPLASEIVSPSTPTTSCVSMLMLPKSFTSTATLNPWSAWSIRLSSVVLPAPRKPVRIVTGTGRSGASIDMLLLLMDNIMVTTGDAECSMGIPDHGAHGRPVAGWRTPASARCVSGN